MSWNGTFDTYQSEHIVEERHHNALIQETLDHFKYHSARGHRIQKAPEAIENCLQFNECTFVPDSIIDQYFEDKERITTLLLAIYGRERELPVDAGEIWSHYIVIFLILLSIGEGSSIVNFVRQQKYKDKYLPFSLERSADGEFPQDFPLQNDAACYAFEQEQWRFRPYVFEAEATRLRIGDSWILPISSVQVIKPGTGVTITKIEIHEEYDKLRDPTIDTDDCHTYVLKSSPVDDTRRAKCHEAEVTAYTIIRSSNQVFPDQIVGFFGGFFQGLIANIVLEYADAGTLEEYFNDIAPPVTRDEQMDFWSAMRELVLGLQKVHRVAPGSNVPGVSQGYHQDLKPSNVLVFRGTATSPYKYQFKIADLGTSYFLRRLEYERNVSGEGQPGVTTYGSPESYRAQREARHRMINGQASDVWSFACIFSVATTWVVGGSSLIDRYAHERRAARKVLGLEDMDCFHDNHKLLPEIERWHRRLVEYARKNDDITVRIWPRVLKPALLEQVYSRNSIDQLQSEAAELCTRGGWAEAETRVNEICKQALSWEALILHEHKWHVRRMNGDLDPRHSRQDTLSIDSSTSAYYDASSTGYLPSRRVMSEGRYHEEPVPIDPVPNQGHPYQLMQSPTEHSRRFHTTRREQDLSNHPSWLSKSSMHSQTTAAPARTGSVKQPSTNRLSMIAAANMGSHPRSAHPAADVGRPIGTASFMTPVQARHPPSTQAGDQIHYPSCPKSKRQAEPLPYKSVVELLRYERSKPPKTDERLKESMKGRDIVFLVDDSKSMLENHWDEAARLFEGLAVFLEDCDEDGMALRFAVSIRDDKQGKAKMLANIVKTMSRKQGIRSDPTSALSKCFQDHKKSIREGKRKINLLGRKVAKSLSIIVLTDGNWGDQTDLASIIRDIVEYVDEPPKLGHGPVGIQFIRFGNDELAIAKLDSLDDLHKDRTVSRDIVDTVASTGNVWKMILGPTNKNFDEDEEAQCTCGLES